MKLHMEKRGTILVIEDEEAINDLICMNLEAAGYEVLPFLNGDQASKAIRESEEKPQLAVLDIMLPGKDGFALLPELKEAQIPVIFLTAKGDLASKVRGLKEGAEDYLVKPFEMLELLVRIEKILNRRKSAQECYTIRDVQVYPRQRVVKQNGREIPFKPMEFDCLLLLIRYKNIAISREQMLQALWGIHFEGETRTIDVHIGRIRKKLNFQDVIKTVPRIGYRLEEKE